MEIKQDCYYKDNAGFVWKVCNKVSGDYVTHHSIQRVYFQRSLPTDPCPHSIVYNNGKIAGAGKGWDLYFVEEYHVNPWVKSCHSHNGYELIRNIEEHKSYKTIDGKECKITKKFQKSRQISYVIGEIDGTKRCFSAYNIHETIKTPLEVFVEKEVCCPLMREELKKSIIEELNLEYDLVPKKKVVVVIDEGQFFTINSSPNKMVILNGKIYEVFARGLEPANLKGYTIKQFESVVGISYEVTCMQPNIITKF